MDSPSLFHCAICASSVNKDRISKSGVLGIFNSKPSKNGSQFSYIKSDLYFRVKDPMYDKNAVTISTSPGTVTHEFVNLEI